jgi:hypothetical protein
LAGLVAATAGASAHAGLGKRLPDMPRFKLLASSHSTAAAQVLAFHGVKTSLPQVVLIGGLEGRIYRCDCGKDIYLWDVAEGTRLWAAAEGLKVKTEARVLRGLAGVSSRIEPQIGADERRSLPASGGQDKGAAQSSPSKEQAAGKPTSAEAAAGSPRPVGVPHSGGRLDFAHYRQAVDAGWPVVLTYSLDAASDKGMQASFESQDRVSVVGIGYEEGNPDRYVVALLPEDAGKEKRFERLAAMPGVKPGERPGTLLIPWEVPTGNVIATFITVEGN